MSSLSELPELVGFFSYSRSDDQHSGGALSRLRARIHDELRLQLGRDVRLWQDTAAIPDGTLWADEIKRAVAESAFFIPIVTPSAVGSPHCKHEFDSFLKREEALGRHNLVFPILYIRVPGLEDEQQRRENELLRIICARQYVDWQKLRLRDWASADVAERIEQFGRNIVDALRQPWLPLEERQRREQAEARRRAEERLQQEEELRRKAAAEAERQRLELEAAATREADERARQEAAVEAERQRRERNAAARRKAEEKARHEEQLKKEENERRQEEADDKRRSEQPQVFAAGRADTVGAVEQGPEPRKPWQASRQEIAIGALGVGMIVAVWVAFWLSPAPPIVVAPLSPESARALKPKDSFKECYYGCPEMIVVPAGSFMMGSPSSEQGRSADESPQHSVTIARPFAVGRFAVTFDEWDACVADSGCNGYTPSDQGWGRGHRPVINVSWDDANTYVAWLTGKTGNSYRLLSEAEFEYAARAGTQTAYSWGNGIGNGNANCNGCGSQWDEKQQTAPVGSFAANALGLYDMAGNVWEWAQDCYHDNYSGAPSDGSAWASGYCARVVRGGSWYGTPQDLRSANRLDNTPDYRRSSVGFRVGRTLTP
jgi:formylglycine-generating enzyme required for sulfatase activity